MDSNNRWQTPQPEQPPMEGAGVDWRNQLQPDSRHRIVNKIMDTLKRHLPLSGQEGVQELNKIAMKFEEKIYHAATSQSDYLRRISLKMLTMESKSNSPMPNAMQSNPAGMGRNPQDPDRVSMDSNDWRQTPQPGQPPMEAGGVDCRNQLQHDFRHRIVNKMVQELNETAMRFEEKIYHAATSQSDYLRRISLEMLTMESKSTSPMPNAMQSNSAGMGRNPQDPASLDSTAQTGNSDWQEEVYQKIKVMKDSYFADVLEIYQKICSKLKQHESLPQQPKPDGVDKLKLFKQILECTLNFLQISKSNIQPAHEEKLPHLEKQILSVLNASRPRKPVPLLQQGHVPPHMQSLQQSQQSHAQVPQSHNSGVNSQLQMLHIQLLRQQQQQLNMQQLKQQQPGQMQGQQFPHPHQMSDVSDLKSWQTMGVKAGLFPQHHSQGQRYPHQQTGNFDWKEEVYQKIKVMKDSYFDDILETYQKVCSKLKQHESLSQQPKPDGVDKLKIFKQILERTLNFLQISKSNIQPVHKEKLPQLEKQIQSVLSSNRPRKPIPLLQQGPVPPRATMGGGNESDD